MDEFNVRTFGNAQRLVPQDAHFLFDARDANPQPDLARFNRMIEQADIHLTGIGMTLVRVQKRNLASIPNGDKGRGKGL